MSQPRKIQENGREFTVTFSNDENPMATQFYRLTGNTVCMTIFKEIAYHIRISKETTRRFQMAQADQALMADIAVSELLMAILLAQAIVSLAR